MHKTLNKKISFLNLPNYFYLFLLFYFLLLIISNNSIYLFIGDERIYNNSVFALSSGFIDSNNHPLLAKTIWFFTSTFFGILTGSADAIYVRAGTILFSLLTLVVLYKIARFFFTEKIAFVVAFLVAIDPMYFVFSRILALEIIIIFFSLTSLYLFLLFSYAKRADSLYMNLAGVFLGLSLAVKMSTLFVGFSYLLIITYKLKKEKISKLINYLLSFLLFVITGFTVGNFIFFFKKSPVNFFVYTLDLFVSQLNMEIAVTNYLSSTPWSWFTVPQILTLFRLDYGETVQTIATFQNPLIFALSIISFLAFTFFLIKRKLKKQAFHLIILLYISSAYLFWFFSLHTTYYYYILIFSPLLTLLAVGLIAKTKFQKQLMIALVSISVVIFTLYFPILVGLKVPKSYEKLLFSYSSYQYPPKDSLFCQLCSPRIK